MVPTATMRPPRTRASAIASTVAPGGSSARREEGRRRAPRLPSTRGPRRGGELALRSVACGASHPSTGAFASWRSLSIRPSTTDALPALGHDGRGAGGPGESRTRSRSVKRPSTARARSAAGIAPSRMRFVSSRFRPVVIGAPKPPAPMNAASVARAHGDHRARADPGEDRPRRQRELDAKEPRPGSQPQRDGRLAERRGDRVEPGDRVPHDGEERRRRRARGAPAASPFPAGG